MNALPELTNLDLDRDEPYIGAGVTFQRLAADLELVERYPVLAQAAATVGSVQIRRTATIGGNVANASPAADGISALIAVGAVVEITSVHKQRSCPLEDLITGPYKTTLSEDELILGFILNPIPTHRAQLFKKVGRRSAVSVARLNLAICLDSNLDDPRVVLGSCFPTPRRLIDVEKLIRAGRPGSKLWQAAGKQAASHFINVCGIRESAAYKAPAIERVTSAALRQAWALRGEKP